MAEAPNPKTTSSAYDAMVSYWKMVSDILGGAPSMRAAIGSNQRLSSGPAIPVANLIQLNASGRAGPQSPYLPQFPNETDGDYARRRRHAPFTNIYGDISRHLTAKPFSKELQLSEDTDELFLYMSEDVDGQKNSLHVFARDVFKQSVDKGIHWVFVDFPRSSLNATLADERETGARPYWISIPAERMLAVYSDFVAGVETIVHARIYEPMTKRVNYSETVVERIRILNRAQDESGSYGFPTWELWEQVESSDKKKSWLMVDGGAMTLPVIPLQPFICGERYAGWLVDPPLSDLAYMQIEEFQQESNLKNIKELTAFPMLAGNGVSAPTGADGSPVAVPVGPRAVLFAPPNSDGSAGNWTFIEPTAASLTFLQSDIERIRTEMRDLGMQPLATANLTVVTTANISMKAHNQVQAWALGLKDALEQAWIYTAMWVGQPDAEIEVKVHFDFGVSLEAGTEIDGLLKAQTANVISKQTTFDEFKRRGILSDEVTYADEEERLAAQQSNEDLSPEEAIDPITGLPLVV